MKLPVLGTCNLRIKPFSLVLQSNMCRDMQRKLIELIHRSTSIVSVSWGNHEPHCWWTVGNFVFVEGGPPGLLQAVTIFDLQRPDCSPFHTLRFPRLFAFRQFGFAGVCGQFLWSWYLSSWSDIVCSSHGQRICGKTGILIFGFMAICAHAYKYNDNNNNDNQITPIYFTAVAVCAMRC